jgi:hypothetical protein
MKTEEVLKVWRDSVYALIASGQCQASAAIEEADDVVIAYLQLANRMKERGLNETP